MELSFLLKTICGAKSSSNMTQMDSARETKASSAHDGSHMLLSHPNKKTFTVFTQLNDA